MAKSGQKNNTKVKKDIVQPKSGSGAIIKAKEKRKKSAIKKVKEKLGEEIQSANAEFAELQSTMICEKENKIIESDKTKQTSKSKDSGQPTISQEKQVEETTSVLANL